MKSTQNNKTIKKLCVIIRLSCTGGIDVFIIINNNFVTLFHFHYRFSRAALWERWEREAFISPKNDSIYLLHCTSHSLKTRKGVDLIFTLYLSHRRRHFLIFVEYSFWHRLLIRSQPIELQLHKQYLTTQMLLLVFATWTIFGTCHIIIIE